MSTFSEQSAANWTAQNPTLGKYQFGIESDTGKAKRGDGVTAWNLLGYFDSAGVVSKLAAVTNASAGSMFYADGAGNLVEFTGDANLGAADLTGQLLAGSIFPNSDWSGTNTLKDCLGASLSGIFWPGANLGSQNLTGGMNLIAAHLRGANLAAANLTAAVITGADLAYANLDEATLESCNLDNANLEGASLNSADCTNADFDSANLLGVDFTGTILTGATLPANAATKAEFKALVGAWDAVTTIWTDGDPIGV